MKFSLALFVALVGLADLAPTTVGQTNPQDTGRALTNSFNKETAQATIRATFVSKQRIPVTDWKPAEIVVKEGTTRVPVTNLVCGGPEPLTIGLLLQIGGADTAPEMFRRMNEQNYRALLSFANSFSRSNSTVFVTAFDENLYEVVPLSQKSNTISVDEAMTVLKARKPTHYSNPYLALQKTIESQFAHGTGRKILIVLSDFSGTDKEPSAEALAREAVERGVEVFALRSNIMTDYELHWPGFRYYGLPIVLPSVTGGASYDLDGSTFSTPMQVAIPDIKRLLLGACTITYISGAAHSVGQPIPLQVHVTREMNVEIYAPKFRVTDNSVGDKD